MEPRKSTRNLYNSSRRQENSTLDLVDRISALPDAILGVILSYLPTKNAVATAILSKRWKFAWMTVSNLDFCYDHDCTHEDGEDVKFVQFVNRVLLIPDGGLLNKLLLVWQTSFIPSQASLWINTAITRNVHELLLFVGSPSDPWDLPLNLLSCETLQCLQLNGCISISAAVVVSLPRLETLTLVSVCYESEETFRKLISGGCPMLNDLYVEDLDVDGFTKHYGEDDVFKYRISSPFLRRLELCDNQWDFEIPRTLELEASSLEYLDLTGPINQVFVQGSLSSLVEASLMVNLTEYNEDSYNSLAKGVGSFHCAKALDLSHDVMWALGNATISLSTKFRRLTRLTAHVVCCYCSTLQDFIQSSDNLKVLTIYKQTYDLARFDHDHSNWTAPVEVSKCLSNSLKVVSFDCYSGCDDEREMIGYMLKHGSALEVMQITCDEVNSKGKKLELIKEKCRFPRRSPNCIVEFISKHDASPHSQ